MGEGLVVAEAFRAVCARYPALKPYSESVMYAVNAQYVPADHPLKPGEELAVIPPVSGGGRAV